MLKFIEPSNLLIPRDRENVFFFWFLHCLNKLISLLSIDDRRALYTIASEPTENVEAPYLLPDSVEPHVVSLS